MSDIFKKLKGISFGLGALQEEADELLSELKLAFRFDCVYSDADLEQLLVDLEFVRRDVKKFFGIDEGEEKKLSSSESTWVSSHWINDWAVGFVGCLTYQEASLQIRAMLEDIKVACEK